MRREIVVDKTALILVIVGALNWGLVSLFKFDLVASLFGGSASLISRIIYGVIAIAGIYSVKFLMDGDRVRE